MGEQARGTRAVVAGLGLGLLLAGTPNVRGQTVSAVPKLDEPRILRTWYEVARFPNKRQKKCIGDAVELIAPGEKKNELQLVDSCATKVGYPDVRNYTARPQDKSGDGKFKVTTHWPFTRKYWVLALGPDYEWALVGSPNHKDLWIFSKTRTLSPDVLAQIKAKASAEGFDAEKLVMTPQSKPQS